MKNACEILFLPYSRTSLDSKGLTNAALIFHPFFPLRLLCQDAEEEEGFFINRSVFVLVVMLRQEETRAKRRR